MKISTKGRYALRMVIDLSVHQQEGYVSLKDIANRQNISKKYLEQIVPMLNKSGILKTNRGNRGGYMLNKLPSELTVKDVLIATEGSLAPVACLEDEVNTCERAESCVTLGVWKKIYKAVNDVVDNITLQDLVDDSKAIEGDYVI